MSDIESPAVEEFEFRAQMRQLLHLIVNSLYTHREIFLRELISNAADALNKVRFRQLSDHTLEGSESNYRIKISLNRQAKTLTVADNGIGMTRQDLTERIGTIASSGTLAFLDEIKKSGKPLDASLIGQFGVGFYASFMVADKIVIETRHAEQDAHGLRWTSDGGERYTITESKRKARGTKVILHLKKDAMEFIDDYRVKDTIRKYSNFVDFPVFVGWEQVNTVKALWRKRKDDVTDEERNEFYKFVTLDFLDPLGHLHLHIEGVVNFDALLFVPPKAPSNFYRDEEKHLLHLYCSGVFIHDDATSLVPGYLSFLRGVVDTDDLPLNVSREVTQSSPVTAKIQSILTGKILAMLAEWAEEDGDRYDTFFRQFGQLFKTGLTVEFDRRAPFIELLRYDSTETEDGATTSLRAYVDRMPETQESIYYLLGDNLNVARRNPKLEYFSKNGIEVLLMVDPVDVFTIIHFREYDKKPLQSIERADLDLNTEAEEGLPGDDADMLLALFRVHLGDKIRDIVASKRLVGSAATLAVSPDGQDTQTERMYQIMNPGYARDKKILEVNTAHPLMKNIVALKDEEGSDELIGKAIHQIFEGALLMDGDLKDIADFVERMTEFMVEATDRA